MAQKIVAQNLNYVYHPRTAFAHLALNNVSFTIKPGAFTTIVGKTGSGKSTLVQLIDLLLKPVSGQINVNGLIINHNPARKTVKKIRHRVGLVFQDPSAQLFGDRVSDDIAFGPKHSGAKQNQIIQRVHRVVKELKIPSQVMNQSPYDLSGGQQELVAIAGVLTDRPQILILDEPTVGLDSNRQIMVIRFINWLRVNRHLTVIMITHQMKWVAAYSTQVLVLDRGRLIADVTPRQLFSNLSLLKSAGLRQPFAARIATRLGANRRLNDFPITLEELVKWLDRKAGRNCG